MSVSSEEGFTTSVSKELDQHLGHLPLDVLELTEAGSLAVESLTADHGITDGQLGGICCDCVTCCGASGGCGKVV